MNKIIFDLKSQKDAVIRASKRAISYVENGPQSENDIKPYYMYRFTVKNEFKEYLVGYNINAEDKYPTRDERLITRSKDQIEEDINGNNIKHKHVSTHILAEKVDGKWEIFIDPKCSLSGSTLTISNVEGIPYMDSVWLQDEDKAYAIELLLKGKINAINYQQKLIDSMKEKEELLTDMLHKLKYNKENLK